MEGKRDLGHHVQLCEEEAQGDFQTAHKIMKRMHLIRLSISSTKPILSVGHPRSHLLKGVVQRMRI